MLEAEDVREYLNDEQLVRFTIQVIICPMPSKEHQLTSREHWQDTARDTGIIAMENDLRRMTQLRKELEPLREGCQAKLDDLAITYLFPGMQ